MRFIQKTHGGGFKLSLEKFGMRPKTLVAGCFAILPTHSFADVITSGPDHYHLMQTATTSLSQETVWARLIEPAQWWHHSYSGDARNFSLDLNVGGLWREEWRTESGNHAVEHGRILYIKDGEQLRLDAPFGPLQDMAVTVIWTITLEPHTTERYPNGTKVTFNEVASGSSVSELDKIAPVVDTVKTEGLARLVKPAHSNDTP